MSSTRLKRTVLEEFKQLSTHTLTHSFIVNKAINTELVSKCTNNAYPVKDKHTRTDIQTHRENLLFSLITGFYVNILQTRETVTKFLHFSPEYFPLDVMKTGCFSLSGNVKNHRVTCMDP